MECRTRQSERLKPERPGSNVARPAERDTRRRSADRLRPSRQAQGADPEGHDSAGGHGEIVPVRRHRRVSLHAAVWVRARDRRRLEQLCRSIIRPALSDKRVQINSAGQVVLKLKTLWRGGTTHLVMRPLEFMQRLAALVPRPRLRQAMTALHPGISRVGLPLGVDARRPVPWTRRPGAVARSLLPSG